MLSEREPAVAGMFYPDEPALLAAEVRGLLDESAADAQVRPKALIAPHAGYVYSGPVAASAYRQVRAYRDQITRVVLLGPSHRIPLAGMAFPSVERFVTPLGAIELDRAAIDKALELPHTGTLDAAHDQEHALEVQLPFLQTALDAFLLVPFVVGRCDPEPVAAVLELLWGGPETLIVVSSDLSHYLPYEQAVKTDRQTSEAIEACSTVIDGEEACGAGAINGLLTVAGRRGMQVRMLDLKNSGDTAGDQRRVVGYGAYAVT
jgi:AmmeMemoRadiSam system protein B